MRLLGTICAHLRRPRFGLRAIFCLLTLICIILAAWAAREQRYRARVAALTLLVEEGWDIGAYVDNGYPIDAEQALGWPDAGRRVIDGYSRSLQRDDEVVYAQHVHDFSDAQLAALMRFRELRVLKIEWLGPKGERITESQLREIGRLHRLEKLNLDNTCISDNGIRHLANLSALRVLVLSLNRGISGDAFVGFSALRSLEELDLHGTGLTDEGVRHLSAFSSLRLLDLRTTRISDAAVQYLSALDALETLRLDETEVTDEGVRHLGPLGSLRVLDLGMTSVTGASFSALASLTRLDTLQLYETPVTDDGIGRLTAIASLRHLNLNRTKISDGALSHLSTMSRLEELWLGGNNIGDESLRYLERLPRLRSLDLSGTHVADEGLESLSRFAALEDLQLRDCAAISDAGLAQLAEAKSLQNLTVYDTSLTAAGVARFKELNPRIRVNWDEANKSQK